MSILIIDDSPDSRALIQADLEAGGYFQILMAESPQDACRQLSRYDLTMGAGIELILMNITMPEMNGIDGCRMLKAMEGLQDIPIIMVTAETEAESLASAFEAGAMDYITKPVKKKELLARVRSALMQKREVDRRKARELELKQINQELEQALQEVKVLRGHLPICVACKKIRDDKGYWSQIEIYIREHSEAEFTHSLCPDCAKKYRFDI